MSSYGTRPSTAVSTATASNMSTTSSTSNANAAIPPHVRLPLPGIPRRVSYVLPTPGCTTSRAPQRPLKVFALPPAPAAGEHRPSANPLLVASPHHSADDVQLNQWSGDERHPRHSLAVTSLAIDTTTRIKHGQHSRSDGQSLKPEGILYTGGRDGLICSWELGLPLRQAKPRPRKKRRKANFLRPHDDDVEEEDEEDDAESAAGDHDEEINRVIQLEFDREAGRPHGRASAPVRQHSASAEETAWEVDHAALPQASKKRHTQFRQCLQSHTDWINDIILCNHNQTLVSASSDSTVKIWNPHDPSTALIPSTVGSHSDYVRCLAHAPKANSVISGGLDRTVKLWDLEHTSRSPTRSNQGSDRPVWVLPEQRTGHSVYALATTPSASMIAVGTPARSVRLWDPRAAPNASPIANLIGHTDNIRALLLSADGRHLLSGSSDSTIRLWSIAEQRCLHTFTHHNDSVWSLFSSDNNLDAFYSGDRQGYLCKVDLEGCGDISEGECLVLAKTEQDGTTLGAGGIQKIVALDNAFVWTATGSSSVRMWRDLPSRTEREALFPISDTSVSFAKTRNYNLTEHGPPSATEAFRRRQGDSPAGSPRSAQISLPSGSPSSPKGQELDRPTTPRATNRAKPPAEHLDWQDANVPASRSLYGVPFESLVSLAPANDPYGAAVGLGSTSIRDLPGALGRASLSFVNASRSSFAFLGRGQGANPDVGGHPGHPLALIPSRGRSIFEGNSYPTPPVGQAVGASSPSSHANGAHVSFHAGDPLKKDRSASVLRFAPHVDINEVPGLPVPEHAIDDEDLDDAQAEPEPASDARLAYEDRELAEDASPFRKGPRETIEGADGLIRCAMLNDRRHVLTVDSRGQLAIWDILAAQMLGVIDPTAVSQAASTDEVCLAAMAEKDRGSSSSSAAGSSKIVPQTIPAEILDLVKTRLEGEGACAPWCTVDVKTGSLTVHLEEPRCFDAEIYLDDCADFVDATYCRDDRRINIGKWVLRNLFENFIDAEVQMRVQEQATLLTGVPAFEHEALFKRRPLRGRADTWSGQEEHVYTPGVTIPLSATPKSPVVSRPLRLDTLTQLNRTPAPAVDATPTLSTPIDYFSIGTSSSSANGRVQTPVEYVSNGAEVPSTPSGRWAGLSLGGSRNTPGPAATLMSRSGTAGTDAAPVTPSTPTGGFMGRLRAGLGNKGAKDKAPKTAEAEKQETKSAVDGNADTTSDSKQAPHVVSLRQILERPLNITSADEFPPLRYDPETSVLVSEAVPDIGSWEVVYRGVAGCTGCDVSLLELVSPVWLLEFTLASRILARDQATNKLSFTLHPWVDPDLSQDGKWKPGQNSLPALPAGNVRLSATRMLRMRKISMYVCEKLDLLPARKHTDSIAGSVRSNTEGTKTPSGLSMTTLSDRKGSAGHVSTLAPGSTGHDDAAAAATELQAQERARIELAKSIEILYGGIVLRPEMTLAQCQRFYHRAGGDIKLEYRQRTSSSA
ncbi:hypothetical protein V8E36_004629 [Tilletia maclaganii]